MSADNFAFARPVDDNSSNNNDPGTAQQRRRMMSSFEIDANIASASHSNNNTRVNNNNNNSANNNKNDNHHQFRAKNNIKTIGKKLGGALQKVNVIKWIGDLEQDQHLADELDKVNFENTDEQERYEIRRQAMEACMNAMEEHLLEFLQQHPQGTYEEWICQLHPDNINERMIGLTQTPLIDHRFYVADSDHRRLWNEHLNDDKKKTADNNTCLSSGRHFVPARTFQQADTTSSTANNNNNNAPPDVTVTDFLS